MPLRAISPREQFFDAAGEVLGGGKVSYFTSGTNDFIDLFFDINGALPAPNPVILGADGVQPNTFFDGTAKFVLTDKNDVQIDERDPVGGEAFEGVFSDWNSITVYNESAIVTGSDGRYYRSIIPENNNNNPVPSPTAQWEEIQFISIWNTAISYSENDTVKLISNGLFYRSLTDNNLGNDPLTSPADWQPLITEITDIIKASTNQFAYNFF